MKKSLLALVLASLALTLGGCVNTMHRQQIHFDYEFVKKVRMLKEEYCDTYVVTPKKEHDFAVIHCLNMQLMWNASNGKNNLFIRDFGSNFWVGSLVEAELDLPKLRSMTPKAKLEAVSE